MKLKTFEHFNCSLAQTLSVIGEHWTMLIIRDALRLVLGRLQLWGAYPDAVLLYVAWLGLRQGRRIGADLRRSDQGRRRRRRARSAARVESLGPVSLKPVRPEAVGPEPGPVQP